MKKHKSFNNFILHLYSIHKDAAQWLARECVKNSKFNEGGDKSGYIAHNRNPIDKWKNEIYGNGYTLDTLLYWSGTPQDHEYWSKLYDKMKDTLTEWERDNGVQ